MLSVLIEFSYIYRIQKYSSLTKPGVTLGTKSYSKVYYITREESGKHFDTNFVEIGQLEPKIWQFMSPLTLILQAF